jgi:hypothetical protein
MRMVSGGRGRTRVRAPFAAHAHLRFAEQQIAQPEREHFART